MRWWMFSVVSNDKYSYLRVFNKNLLRFKKGDSEDVVLDEKQIIAPFKKKKDKDKEQEREEKKKTRFRLSAILSHQGLVIRIITKTFSTIKRMIRGFGIKKLNLEIRNLGINPFYAGQGYALYYGFVYPYTNEKYRVIYEPFHKGNSCFQVAACLYLYKILAAIIYFVIAIPKRETYRLIKSLRN
ncbi:MAG: hypothetical protein GF315_02385 [candidate division Zixibacteria bacterium]|nr:hypothetical protein [candidate division Zixibacteria bacterium]